MFDYVYQFFRNVRPISNKFLQQTVLFFDFWFGYQISSKSIHLVQSWKCTIYFSSHVHGTIFFINEKVTTNICVKFNAYIRDVNVLTTIPLTIYVYIPLTIYILRVPLYLENCCDDINAQNIEQHWAAEEKPE